MSKDDIIFDFLKDCGLEIEPISDEPEENLKQSGYEKISKEMSGGLDSLLQYIPGLLVEAVERKDAIAKTKKLLEGAYKVSIPKGMHLAKSKATENAFRGTLLSNATNQVAGQAELFKIEGALQLIQAPKYALCFFDAVSAITGQYYMAQINHRLTAIENKSDKILSYMENKTKGELWASDQMLDEIIRNIESIRRNELQKTSYYQNVLMIKRDSLAKMKFFNLQINSHKKHITKQSKEPELQKLITDVVEIYPQYWYAIYLYAKSVMCEIILAQIEDPKIITDMRDSINYHISNYKSDFTRDRKEITKVIENAKTYNLRKLPLLSMSHDLALYSTIAGIASLSYEIISTVENVVADSKTNKQKEVMKTFNDDMEEFADTSLLAEQVNAIDNQIFRLSSPIDIVQIGDDTYIKYIEKQE